MSGEYDSLVCRMDGYVEKSTEDRLRVTASVQLRVSAGRNKNSRSRSRKQRRQKARVEWFEKRQHMLAKRRKKRAEQRKLRDQNAT